MATVAIIPARGGSKGLRRKNLAPVNGVPMVLRAVKAATLAGCDSVVVTTDDDEIANAVFDNTGATVVMRPPELATDDATSEEAILDVCEQLDIKGDTLIAFVQCTTPLTAPADIAQCLEVVNANRLSVAVTAARFHGCVWRDNGPRSAPTGVTHDPSLPRQRRQDMPALWQETGGVYAFEARRFLKLKTRFCGLVIPVMVPSWRAVEVDDATGLQVADALARIHDELPDLSRFKALVLDFDGVLTDRKVATDSDGQESVVCSKLDSTGIMRLKAAGVHVSVLTHETDPCVLRRCRKLGIDCHMTDVPKEEKIARAVRNVPLSEVVYIGDDVPDVAVMGLVGLACCPADAHPAAKAAAGFVLSRNGGDGCVREVCDMMLKGRRAHEARMAQGRRRVVCADG